MGGLSPGLGPGVGAEEDDGRLSKDALCRPGCLPPAAAVPVVVEAVFEAFDAPAEAVAFGAVDDVAAGALEEVEQEDEEVGDELN